jgi:signal transduction histidine kinase
MGSVFRTIRVRLALFGTLLMIGALFVAGIAFDRAVRNERTGELERAAIAKLDAMCDVVKGASIPTPLPAERDSLLLVQVIRADGTVASSTPNVMDMNDPFINPLDYETASAGTRQWTASIEGMSYLLAGRKVSPAANAESVYVAAPFSDVERLSASLRRQMLQWAPLVVLATAAGLVLLVRGSLKPVEAMRQQVQSIEASDLTRRVTETGAKDEIGSLAKTMNQMLGRLQQSAEHQARFVSDASHELRTPLAVMRTRLEVGLRRPEGTDWTSTAGLLLQQNARMERLVSDLLLLAKGGQTKDRREEVDLDELIRQHVADRRLLGDRVSFDVSRVSAGRTVGDPDQLGRVVQNLVENAVVHAVSSVCVSLGVDGSEAVLVVEDDGPGVAPADRDRVFERFTRLDSSRASTSGGSGLGLAIVSGVIERHGGTVRFADPQLLGGARVEVRLPLAQ